MRALIRSLRSALLALGLVLPAGAAAQDAPPSVPAERDSLEAQVRRRMSQMLRNQLGLDDEQVRRLQSTNRRFEGQRRALFDEERDVRMNLRRAINSGDTGNVGGLLDRMIALQRQRLDLTEAEQKELATFLTPVQRARLFGMEEQIRRRMMEMRDQRTQRPAPGRRPGAPPTRRPPPG